MGRENLESVEAGPTLGMELVSADKEKGEATITLSSSADGIVRVSTSGETSHTHSEDMQYEVKAGESIEIKVSLQGFQSADDVVATALFYPDGDAVFRHDTPVAQESLRVKDAESDPNENN